jgi:ferredoxin-type protein NapH
MTVEQREDIKKWIIKLQRPTHVVMGSSLFLVSLLLARNVQIEGLFFGLLTGVFIGAVIHYALGKLLIPFFFGRIWCGWACWTTALLDLLPYRKSAGWLHKRWRKVRYVHFFLSLIAVTLLVVLGYRSGVLGHEARYWFVIGNLFYWFVGIILAVTLKDNRAFCKYVCPVAVPLKITSRLSLFKVSGDAKACLTCKSKACTTLCPMDIQIPDYILQNKRVLATECILCQNCVCICPPNTLKLSAGLDVAGLDLLEERPHKEAENVTEAKSQMPFSQ